jgi:3-phenylpropionate/trans-cinnamate dioxygenase ferredoxin component
MRTDVQIRELPIAQIRSADLLEGVPLHVHYPPFDIVVVKLGDEVFALEDACNHAGASLATGDVRDMCIECPLHSYEFDLRSGALVRPQGLCGPQRTFRVEADADGWAIYESPRTRM